MNKSFNVLQCLSQPTWHSEADNIKCSLSGKKKESLLYDPFVFSQASKQETSFFFPSLFLHLVRDGSDWTTMGATSKVTWCCQDSNWLCRKPPWSPVCWSTCFNSEVSMYLNSGKPKEFKKKKKKEREVFSTVSVDSVRTGQGSMWDQAGVWWGEKGRQRRQRGNVGEDSVLLCYFSRFFFCS